MISLIHFLVHSVSMRSTSHTTSGVPTGLEYLTKIDQLIIKQKVEILESLTGCEGNNKYSVMNSMGQKVIHPRPHSTE